MTQIAKPYFAQNKDWYVYNEKKGIIELTDKAPPKAVESYNEFYETLYSFQTVEEEEPIELTE